MGVGDVILPRAYGLWALSQATSRSTAERQTEGSEGYASPQDEPKGQSPRQSCPGFAPGPGAHKEVFLSALFNRGGECLPVLYNPEPDWNSCWVLLLLLLFLNHGFFRRQILHTTILRSHCHKSAKRKQNAYPLGACILKKPPHTP